MSKQLSVFPLFLLFFLSLYAVDPVKVEPTTQPKAPKGPIKIEKLTRAITPLEQAVLSNDYAKASMLLQQKESPNPPDTDQGFPLIYAVLHDNIEMAKLLLDHKADINAKMKTGMSALYLAVTRNQVMMTKLLVERGANVNQKLHKTSLHNMATAYRYELILKILEKAGAKGSTTAKKVPAPAKKI